MLRKALGLYRKYKLNRVINRNRHLIQIDESTILNDTFNIEIRNLNFDNKRVVEIGENSMLACQLIFEKNSGKISIGDRTYIAGKTSLISIDSIEIGNDVIISWGCTIYDHNSHSIYWDERKNDTMQSIIDLKENGNFIQNKNWNVVKSKPIKIGDKVWIGFDCVILKGVTIGEGAVIGARSVVTKDVPPYSVVAGNPAKVLKYIDR
ncbi:acyltransferase [Clostridium intestinale]|uniref:Acyltransferase n=1 Tax=Clostridium intestinale TaxID=36845 RepID=A0A7D7A2U2_9CLOT|nr:acyltransferase [Clostridium intestinale]QLY79120.1 acyltransferase [Clostridium intestinale]